MELPLSPGWSILTSFAIDAARRMRPGGWLLPGAVLVRSPGRKLLRLVVCPEALDHGVELVDREQEKILVIADGHG